MSQADPSRHAAPARITGIHDIPPDIQLVWHGVNDAVNLREFLASDVPWCELDVTADPDGSELALRHDTFAERPRGAGEPLLYLRQALPRLLDRGKSIKFDFKSSGPWLDVALAQVDELRIPTDRLWLNGDLDLLGEPAIRAMAARYPGAVIQVPFTSLHVPHAPSEAFAAHLAEVCAWGVNRFSVGWHLADVPGLAAWLKAQGYEFNLYGVRTLEQFLQAVALHPDAVTADFNFPRWGYYGRGSGHEGHYHTYTLA